MILIFTPVYEDMIFLITNLGGFPMNGRLLDASEYEPFKAAGRKQAEDFGYIKAPCSLFKGSPDVIYSWGEDLICENEGLSHVNEKEKEQFENVKGLLTNDSLDSVYAFSIGERTSYIPKLFDIIKPATNSVFLAELESKADFAKASGKVKVYKRPETRKIFTALLEKDRIYGEVSRNIREITEKEYRGADIPSLKSIAVLSAISKRAGSIAIAKAEKQYEVLMHAEGKSGTFTLSSPSAKFESEEKAAEFIRALPSSSSVSKVKTVIKTEKAPGPYSESRIIKDAKSKLGLSEKETLGLLNDMFNLGFITNPINTNSNYPKGKKDEITELILRFKSTKTFAPMLEPLTKYNIPHEYFSDQSPHGIIITDKKPVLSGNERSLYALILTEMIKTLYPPRETRGITVTVEAKAKFSASSSFLLKKGFSELEDRRPIRKNIPEDIKEGEALRLTYSITAKEKSIPSYLTKEDLARIFNDALSPSDLRAALEELSALSLITKAKSAFIPSSKGDATVRIFAGAGSIAEGSFLKSAEDAFRGIEDLTEEEEENTIRSVRKNAEALILELQKDLAGSKGTRTDVSCPACGNSLYRSAKLFLCEHCSFTLPSVVHGRAVSENELRYILKNKRTPLIPGFAGRFYGRIIFEDGTLLYSKESEYRCPSCGKPLSVSMDSNEYVCEGCGFSLPNTVAGHILTKDEIKSLLTDKQTDIIPALSGFIILNAFNGFKPEIIKK